MDSSGKNHTFGNPMLQKSSILTGRKITSGLSDNPLRHSGFQTFTQVADGIQGLPRLTQYHRHMNRLLVLLRHFHHERWRVTGAQMATDYNEGDIAEEYQLSKTLLWRARIEDHSFLTLIGDVTGKKVLDLACGEGHFTRMLRAAGAAEVVGADLSERMVELATKQETEDPLGITYRVEDARTRCAAPEFDIAAAAWLLVYARSRDELANMCDGVASRVVSGGRFVTVLTNPDVVTFGATPDYRKYHFGVQAPSEPAEGAPIQITLHMPDSDLVIENYYLPLDAYTSALTDAGFRNVTVHQPQLSPAAEDEQGYWDEFMKYPLFVLIEGERT